MAKIKSLQAREILDSRSNPTIEAKLELDNGLVAKTAVPSGVSVGKNEAVEIRDQDPKRYHGMGVLKAISHINDIINPALTGQEVHQQLEIDRQLIILDGTKEKAKLGANSILAVSQAVCKAAALAENIPCYEYVSRLYGLKPDQIKIPTPMMVVIEGGKHGSGNLDFQEFMILASSAKTFSQSLQMASEIYHTLERVLIKYQAVHSVGDEGGFAPNLFTNLDAFEAIVEAIRESGYVLNRDVFLSLDAAPAFFYKKGRYLIKDRTTAMNTDELVDFYRELINQYPLATIEDPFYEADWNGWIKLSQVLNNTTVIGDDFLTTNKDRVKEAIRKKACKAILIKPNQIGTIAETIEVIKIARNAGWQTIVSHRGGETNDDFIADFSVGVAADYVKFGAPARGERVAKYNRLLEIEAKLK